MYEAWQIGVDNYGQVRKFDLESLKGIQRILVGFLVNVNEYDIGR